MGAKLTVIENRCNNDIEIRVWVPPARPDKFQRIIRIEGYYFLPIHLIKYAKVICDINEDGLFVVQGIKPTFNFCRF
ncbi:hypothetical protein H5410_042320, partial [Solanum commersonii]